MTPRDGSIRDLPAARVCRRVARQQVALTPIWLIAVGGLVAAVDAASLHLGLLAPLPSLLPIDPDISAPLTAAAVAIGLLALAAGLARHKRVAWWLSLVVLTSALVAQITLLRHLSGAMLAAVCLGILLVDRRRYHVETSARSRWIAISLWGIGTLAAIAAAATAVGATTHTVRPTPDSALWMDSVVSWLAFGNPGIVSTHALSAHLLVTVTLLARMVVVIGVVLALAPADAPPVLQHLLRREIDLARLYGQGALLPFQMGPDTRRFSTHDHRALLAYGLAGRTAVILGEPIGSDDNARALLDQFVEWCERKDWRLACYQASAAGLLPLLARGFHAYRIGREAILELQDFDLRGGRRSNLRHSVARALRGGLVVEWHPHGLRRRADRSTLAQLAALDRSWMADRPPLRFTVSEYRIADMRRLPIALGRASDGGIDAFLTFRPTGTDGGFVLDLIRRRPGAVPGAVEACLAEAATRLRDAGARTLSLGLAPLAGLSPKHGSVVERCLSLGARAIRGTYDVQGLEFFKAKFGPRWEQRYLVVQRRTDLPQVLIALLRLHLGGSVSVMRAGLHLRHRGLRPVSTRS